MPTCLEWKFRKSLFFRFSQFSTLFFLSFFKVSNWWKSESKFWVVENRYTRNHVFISYLSAKNNESRCFQMYYSFVKYAVSSDNRVTILFFNQRTTIVDLWKRRSWNFYRKKVISRELVSSQVDKENIYRNLSRSMRVIASSIRGFIDAKTATIISTRLPIIRERTVRN